MNKYELTDNTKTFCGYTLHQVRYLRDIGHNITAGDLGGWIEKEENLSQYGDAQVCDNAKVFGDAMVYGNAMVYGDALVCGDAKVCGQALVYGDASVYGNAKVFGDAMVCDNAMVYGNARVCGSALVCDNAKVGGNARVCGSAKISQIYDLIVIGPIGSRHSPTSFYRTQDDKILVSCGCFSGDINAFRARVRETHADHPEHLNAYLHAADFAEKLIEGRA